MNTGSTALITIVTLIITLSLLGIGQQISEGKLRPSRGMFYYLTMYMFIAPLWLSRSVYNTLLGKKITWR